MEKVQRFYTYLGFNDTTINADQLVSLICLLTKEFDCLNIPKCGDPIELMNWVLDLYICGMETTFKNITEYDIIEVLK